MRRSSSLTEPAVAGGPPRADLLPVTTREAIRRRPIVRRLIVAVALVALVTVLAIAGVSLLAAVAAVRLSEERARSESLLAAQLEFADARAVAGAIDETTAARAFGTRYEADWNALLEEIRDTLPTGVTLTSVAGRLSGSLLGDSTADLTATEQDPLRGVSIGSFSIQASSPTVPDVEAWLGRLESITGFAGIAPPTTVAGGANEGYAVKIQVLIDEGVFIGRFAQENDEAGADSQGEAD